MELKTRAVLTVSGSGLALIGAFLPWYSEKFFPPGGYAIVDGQRFNAFNHTYTVIAVPEQYTVVRTAILALLCIGVFDVFSLFLSENSARRAAQLLAYILHAPFTQGVKGLIQALALIIEALGYLALSFLAINYGSINFNHSTSPSAMVADHYASISLGIGFYFLVAGIILAGIAVFKTIGILGPIILIVVGFLFFTGGFSVLTQFLHFLGG